MPDTYDPSLVTATDAVQIPAQALNVVPPNAPNIGQQIVAGQPAIGGNQPIGQPTASLPVPPTPPEGTRPTAPTVVPPPTAARAPTQRGASSGVSTPVDEALIRARGDAEVGAANDQLSPTTMVLNYLQKQGLPRTSENVRRALEANARNSTTIPGLVNETAPTAGSGGASGSGGGGSNRPASTQTATPTPANTGDNAGGGGAAGAGGLTIRDLAPYIGAAGAPVAAYYLTKLLDRARNPGAVTTDQGTTAVTTENRGARRPATTDQAEYVGRASPPQNTGRTIDVEPTAITDENRGARATPKTDVTTTRAIDRAVPPDEPNIPFRGPRNAQTATDAAAQAAAISKAVREAQAARMFGTAGRAIRR